MQVPEQFPEPYRRNGTKVYSFMYTDPRTHKRKRKSTGKVIKKEAKKMILAYLQEIGAGITDKTFGEYAAPFFIWETCPHVQRKQNENQNVGLKHIKNSRQWLEMHVFSDNEFTVMRMTDIRRSHILALRERIRKKTSESVVNKTMNAVKVIFTEAFYLEDIDRNPGSKIGALRYKKQVKGVLELDEIKNLFIEKPGIWGDNLCYDVFCLTAQTGMRAGEILALGIDYVNLNTKVIEIHRAWKTRGVLGLPKWDKIREIPFTGKVGEILAENINGKVDLVFCYQDGSRLGGTWWAKRFKKAMEKAGIDYKGRNITPHSLRHSLNTHLVSAGCDIILTQAYLGWSSKYQYLTDVQQGYTHINAVRLRGIADMIERIYNNVLPVKLVKNNVS